MIYRFELLSVSIYKDKIEVILMPIECLNT